MKTILITFFLSLSFMGCHSTKKFNDSEKTRTSGLENAAATIEKFYFKANGNEPFWNVKIGNDSVIFTSLIPNFEKIKFDYVNPILAMDANVKTYRFKNSTTVLNLTITQQKCSDSMSDIVFSYEVRAEIKLNGQSKFQKLEGCGNYFTDYRLYDIWSLDFLNGRKVTSENFDVQKPYIEINTTENTFMGYAGCNTISGKIVSENKLLRFTAVKSTLKMCGSNNEEFSFLKALQSTTTFIIENNQLKLSNFDGDLLVFRKVD